MSERYQKEIEEILRQAGELAPTAEPAPKQIGFRRLAWLQLKQSMGGSALSFSPGRVMLAAVLLLLSALVLNAMLPGITAPLAWAGLILFIVGYGLFFVRPMNLPKTEKRWRGEVIEGDAPSLWTRIRKKMRSR